MATYEQALHAGAAFFKASTEVDREDWQTFVNGLSLERHFPGIEAIGFAKAARHAEKEALEQQMRAEGTTDYTVSPAGERAFYAPVMYVAPFEAGNADVLGFDLYSDRCRRTAMEQARDSGEAILSCRVALRKRYENAEQTGFLMFAPVYQQGIPHSTLEERRTALTGWVYAPFRVDEFMKALLVVHRDELGTESRVEITDLEAGDDDERRIFSNVALPASAPAHHAWVRNRDLSIAGHRWTLRLSADTSFAQSFYTTADAILAGGIVTSLLLFAVAMTLATGRARALALADFLTRELRASNDQLALYARERTAELQTVLSASPIPIAHLIGKRFNWVNPALETLMGYAAAELVANPTKMLFRSDAEFEEFMRSTTPLVAAGGIASSEQVLVTRDGRQLVCEGHIKALDAADLSRGAVAIFKDVTARSRNEEALRESERYNRLLFQASPLGLALCSMDGTIVDANQAYASILGRSVEQTVGLSYWAVTPDKYATGEAGLLEALRDTGRFGPYEKEYIHLDGHLVPVRLSARIIKRGGESFIWAAVEDIADVKANERRIEDYIAHIEKQNLRLAENDRLKTEFLNNMSHELKTPLNAIIGFSELLAAGIPRPLDPEQQEHAQDILDAGRQLFAQINAILTYGRSEAGQLELRPDLIALPSFLDERINAFNDAARAKDVTLSCSVAPECGNFFADRDYLRTIIDHLLSNAIKFTPQGGRVALHAARTDGRHAQREAPCSGMLEISVADTGIGISPQERESLFQPFIQGDGKLTRRAGGAGLGLALASRLVKLHGGTLDVESAPAAGSTFTLRLPWRESREGEGPA
jgi:PAS domain S-box-containing protein